MKKNRAGKVHLVVLSVLAMLAVLCTAGVSEAKLQCYQCHGDGTSSLVPRDTTYGGPASYRNITSGAVLGNHQKHLADTATAAQCGICHFDTAKNRAPQNYSTWHRSGQINFKSNINSSPTAALYSKAATTPYFTNQTTVPTAGTCSNVNCHFQKTTISWGAVPYSYTNTTTNDCDQCHGNGTLSAPQDGSHPGFSAKHTAYYGSGADSCAKCHSDHTLETNKFAHATSAGNRSLILNGTSLVSSNYSLNANLAYPAYMTTLAASRNGTCSNLYCHSDGTTAAGTSRVAGGTAQWGGSVTCASCHGGAVGSASALTTGSHTVHINGNLAGRTNENFTCDQCHKQTTKDGSTIASYTVHVNSLINVNMTSSVSYTGTYFPNNHAPGVTTNGTCSNTICHNIGRTGTSGGTAAATVTWGTNTATNKCAICHGGGNTVGSPDYTSGAAGSATANSHQIHVITKKSYSCALCHQATTTTGTTIVAGGGSHLNGSSQDVSIGGSINGTSVTGSYNAGTKTCSANYCHGTTNSVVWGGPTGTIMTCTSCHGNSASAATLSGKHNEHAGTSIPTWRGTGSTIGCEQCHANVVSNSTTISTEANHVNGLKNYSGAMAYRSQFNAGTGTCSTYCHSNGKGTYSSPGVWTTTAQITTCKGCHGNQGSGQFGEPDYTGSNSHLKHVTAATTCVFCHRNTAGAAAGTIVTGSVDHIDKNIDARLSRVNTFTGYSGAYLSNKTCTNTYCHGGTNTTPAWGAASLACNQCHDASSAGTSWSTKSAHKLHYESTTLPSKYANYSGNMSSAAQYRFTCSACHASGTVGNAVHADGAVDANRAAQVYYSFTTAGKKPTYSSGTFVSSNNGFNYTTGANCNNTYCHSSGQVGGVAGSSVSWGTTANSTVTPSATSRCNLCHGDGTYGNALSGRHVQHVNNATYLGTNFGCVACHAKTVSDNTTISDRTKHVNKFRDYSGLFAGRQASFSGTTCSNVYCHSDGKGNKVVTPSWNATVSALACNACHANTSLAHPIHIAVTGITCDQCHTNTAAVGSSTALKASNTTHINGTYNTTNDVAFTAGVNASATYNSGTKACANNYCHFSPVTPASSTVTAGTVTWAAPTVTTSCEKCHGSASTASTGGTFKSTNGATLVSDPRVGTHVAHVASNSAFGKHMSGNIACDACHVSVASFGDANHLHAGQSVGQAGMAWSTLATGGGKTSPSYNASTGQCSNVYCHAGSSTIVLTGGLTAAKSPTWKSPFLVGGSTNDCNQCHGNPPQNTSHLVDPQVPGNWVSNTSCNGCHSHVNTDGATFNDPTKHINGTVDGGKCNSCHGYPPVTVGQKASLVNFSSARLENYSGGAGVHAIPGHLSPFTRWNNGWGTLGVAGSCLTCHADGNTKHNEGFGAFSTHNVTVNVDSHFKLDKNRPVVYNGKRVTNGSKSSGTCTNVACHFRPSPSWSPVYTQSH